MTNPQCLLICIGCLTLSGPINQPLLSSRENALRLFNFDGLVFCFQFNLILREKNWKLKKIQREKVMFCFRRGKVFIRYSFLSLCNKKTYYL